MYLVSPPGMRSVAGDAYVWQGSGGAMLLTDEDAEHFGVVPFRGMLTHPLA